MSAFIERSLINCESFTVLFIYIKLGAIYRFRSFDSAENKSKEGLVRQGRRHAAGYATAREIKI